MELVKFELEDGSFIYMEVDEKLPVSQSQVEDEDLAGLVGVGDIVIQKASQSLENSLSGIRAIGDAVIDKVKSLNEPADEVEVKFGIKMSADLGAVIAKGSGEVNYEITLKWDKRSQNNEN